MLRSAGMTVMTANGGRAAIEAIHGSASEISVVLLDLTLPDIDGLETLRQIRKLWRQLPVVMSSGYDRQGVAPGLSGFRNVSFLQKPFKRSELISKIREAMTAGEPEA
jgi:CheY-like chemotaxis protein